MIQYEVGKTYTLEKDDYENWSQWANKKQLYCEVSPIRGTPPTWKCRAYHSINEKKFSSTSISDLDKVTIILSHVFPTERQFFKMDCCGEKGVHVFFLHPTQENPTDDQTGDYMICPHENGFIILYYVAYEQTHSEPAGGDYEEFKGVEWAMTHGIIRRQKKPIPETIVYKNIKEAAMQLVALITALRINDAYTVIEEKELDLSLQD